MADTPFWGASSICCSGARIGAKPPPVRFVPSTFCRNALPAEPALAERLPRLCMIPVSDAWKGSLGLVVRLEVNRPLRSEERRVGKGVDLGGRRIIKKKK